MTTEDECTPRERGLLIGREWMERDAAVDDHELEHVLNGEITEGLEERVLTPELDERLDASRRRRA